MKLTTKQKQNKFRQDIYEMGKNGAIVKTHDNTYQIVVCVRDVVFDYYSSTESWSSRGSGGRYKGKGKNDLISLLNKLSNPEGIKLEDEISFDTLMLEAQANNEMIIHKFLNLQQRAIPEGIIEKLAFWIIGKRGYKVIKQKENRDE